MPGPDLGGGSKATGMIEEIRMRFDRLEPWQRTTLTLLVIAVLIAGFTALALVLTDGSEDDPVAVDTTTTEGTTTITDATTTTTEPTTTTTEATTTTTEATTTTTSATTTTTSAASTLTLRPNGLGTLFFGTDAADTITRITDLVGEPDEDTGWVDRSEGFETCIGEEVRFVRWASLQVFLTDGESEWARAGRRHFAAYGLSPDIGEPMLDMTTDEGIGIGSPVGDVRAVYGPEAVADDPLLGPFFEVDPDGAGILRGFLTGLDADDTVRWIEGGFACGE